MITRPTPHWMGQATERIRPTRLVQGADAVRAASSGGTRTQRFQTTARAIRQASASRTVRPRAIRSVSAVWVARRRRPNHGRQEPGEAKHGPESVAHLGVVGKPPEEPAKEKQERPRRGQRHPGEGTPDQEPARAGQVIALADHPPDVDRGDRRAGHDGRAVEHAEAAARLASFPHGRSLSASGRVGIGGRQGPGAAVEDDRALSIIQELSRRTVFLYNTSKVLRQGTFSVTDGCGDAPIARRRGVVRGSWPDS